MITFNKKYFPKKQFILALSGGADSIAVSHFLKQKGFDFIAVHVNNKFIPQDDEIADKVETFCFEQSIHKVILNSKDGKAYSGVQGKNLEQRKYKIKRKIREG